jgi:pyridoxal phosphate enzyme (YggS family)
MGVTKFHPPRVLAEAWAGGLRLFGESRIQEAETKFPAFKLIHPDAELHLIGTLQRNKVKRALELFDCIQSVDRKDLVVELLKRSQVSGGNMELLFELHTGEESKSGFETLDALSEAAELVLGDRGVKIRGLMTMAPYTRDEKVIRQSFRALRSAQGVLQRRFSQADWSVLSMGMTNDFEIAVEEGSTLLRIGTGIFGQRES